MPFKTKRSRSLLIAAMLGAAGLPASMASAQFKVEYDKPAPDKKHHADHEHKAHAESEHHTKKHTEKRVIVISTDEGERTYEINIVDGKVELAKVDGKAVDSKRVKVKGEVIVLLGEDGKTMHEFRMPKAPNPPRPLGGPHSPHMPAEGFTLRRGGEAPQVSFFTQPDAPKAPGGPDAMTPPPVMVGINLSEPSPALRKQMNLSEDRKVILVERVIEGLPADRAGLEDYDIVLSIDGSEQASGEVLRQKLAHKKPGDTLTLVVLRRGEKKQVTVDLTDYDAAALGAPESPTDTDEQTFEFQLEFEDEGEHLRHLRDQAREQIDDALRRQGMEEGQIQRFERFIDDQLGQLELEVRRTLREGNADQIGELGRQMRSQTRDRIADALRRAGLDDEQIRELRQELHSALQGVEEGVRQSPWIKRDEAGWSRWSEEMQAKARDAMRQAERQILELRDGRLVLRSGEQLERRAAELQERLSQAMPDQEQLDARMGELDARLNQLEQRLERQGERMGRQMDRITNMFERLMKQLDERKNEQQNDGWIDN